MGEDKPKLTCGSCWVCDKLVSIYSRDNTKGRLFWIKDKAVFEHTACQNLEVKRDA